MKKIISIFLLMALLVSLAIPVQAISAKAVYTSGSSFKVGGTASIDTVTTRQNVMSDSSVTSDLYNAALEGNMSYHWVSSNGGTQKDGPTVTWTQADVGKEFYCQVAFYSDKDCAWYVDHIISEPVIIEAGAQPKLSPNGGTYYLTLNKPFQLQISCNVQVEEISNYMTPLPNGLSISKNGLISGTPTKEGFWYVTIAAWKGEDDVVADAGFEFYVSKEAPAVEPEITTKSLPEATVGKDYYAKLNCTDGDASFGEYYNPGKPNQLKESGLYITQHGELEGKPTKAGTYTFTICAAGEGGEGYATYTLVVKEAKEEPTEPTQDPTEATTEKPDKADKGNKKDNNKQDRDEEEDDEGISDIVLYVAIGMGVLLVIVVVLIVVLVASKKKTKKETQ